MRQRRSVSKLRNPTAIGILFAVLAAGAYSAMDVTAKMAYREGMNVPTLLSLRFLGAGAGVLGAWWLLHRPGISRSTAIRLFLLGAIAYATESFLLNSAIARMPVGAVILIFYTYPSLIAVASIVVYRERLGALKAAALGLSAAGVMLLLGFPTEGVTVVGASLSFGAAIAFAIYALLAEREIPKTDPVVFSGLVLLGAGVSITLAGSLTGGVRLPLALDAPGWVVLHALLIAMGVAAFLAAVTHLGATRAAIGNTIEPALTVALAAVLVGEEPEAMQLLGGALLLTAVALLPLTRRRTQALDIPVHE